MPPYASQKAPPSPATESGDERLANVMHLRVCRKRLARRVREVLDGIELEESY